jgi:diguanylate cyclase (GGDEF)-like protein/PAS domain S-box-containing protein
LDHVRRAAEGAAMTLMSGLRKGDAGTSMATKTSGAKTASAKASAPPRGNSDLSLGDAPDTPGQLLCLVRRGKIVDINAMGRRLLGVRSKKGIVGRAFSAFVHQKDKPLVRTRIAAVADAGEAVPMCLIRGKGTQVSVIATISRIDGDAYLIDARDAGVFKSEIDALTERHDGLKRDLAARDSAIEAERAKRREAQEQADLAEKILNSLGQAVMILDDEFRVTAVNRAYSALTGYSAKQVLGKAPTFDQAIAKDAALYAELWRCLSSEGRWSGEFWNRRRNKTDYAEQLSISAITDDAGRVHNYAAVINDVTQRKEDEERIRYQANYDALTGLPNRGLFLDRLSQAINNMRRANSKLGLMFIDLDGFKLVNDTLGHDVGDMLLCEAAERLNACVRSGDTVARLGGDEFTVIMPNLVDPRHTPLLAQRILDELAKPFILNGKEAFVSASIGITIFPDDADDAVGLLKNADTAMYRAKEQGKANYQFYTADLNQEVQERLTIKNGLSKALERDEFVLYYQPKLDVQSDEITSCEALMRWQNDDLGFVSPGRFIPVLEETGQVVEVGAWALRTACRQHVEWREAGLPPMRIAVNLSARQLRELSFVDVVKDIMSETGVEPDGIEIEITESMLMSDAQRAVVTLRTLSDLGLHIAMDDFGTGYSSLSYLKRFPIDTIKIDRSFVADITTNADDAEIIRTIITMGQTLNRGVVAEGVETQEQFDLLKSYACDVIQGYLISRPLPGDDFTTFHKSWTASRA